MANLGLSDAAVMAAVTAARFDKDPRVDISLWRVAIPSPVNSVVGIEAPDQATASANALNSLLADPRVSATAAATAATAVGNAATLQTQAITTLAGNATYLALVAPTAAQSVAQVAVLTKQVDAVIQLLLTI